MIHGEIQCQWEILTDAENNSGNYLYNYRLKAKMTTYKLIFIYAILNRTARDSDIFLTQLLRNMIDSHQFQIYG